MGKPAICIGENKGADQLCGNREADQFFFYLNPKFQASSSFSVTVQAGLCQTCSKTTLWVFPRGGSIQFCLFVCYFLAHGEARGPTLMSILQRII